jgi:hypothetical protein
MDGSKVITIFHASTFLKVFSRLVCIGLLLAALPLSADPVPSLDQLTVIDQGAQVTVVWHFFSKLLPPKVTLREKNPRVVTLDDPATLKQNLSELASAAFAITLDGQPDPLTKISELTVAPDGGCFATLLYPGRKNGRLQMRETLLPDYPSSYIINYQVYSPLDRARGVSGYFTGGAPSPIVDYVQFDGNAQPSAWDWLGSKPVQLFKTELRTAWINTNWLFMAILLLLTRPAKDIYPLAWIMAGAWVVPCFFWVMDGLQIPNALHPILPGMATVALCFLCLRPSVTFEGLAIAVGAAGLLNGCFDVQQTSLERPAPDISNLIGLCLGFVAGLALVFAIGFPIVSECRKYPGFQRAWAPKICWALALLALVLPWVK